MSIPHQSSSIHALAEALIKLTLTEDLESRRSYILVMILPKQKEVSSWKYIEARKPIKLKEREKKNSNLRIVNMIQKD